MSVKDITDSILKEVTKGKTFLVPAVVSSLLITFEVYGQQGGVVGGAVRDHVLKRKIRDFDVYIQTKRDITELMSNASEVLLHAKRFGYTVQDCSAESDYEDSEICAVFKLINLVGQEVDVIFGHKPVREFVDRFICDISKVWYDIHSDRVVKTNDFTYAVRYKTAFIQNHRNSHPAVVDGYIMKLEDKFADFKFVRCHEYLNH